MEPPDAVAVRVACASRDEYTVMYVDPSACASRALQVSAVGGEDVVCGVKLGPIPLPDVEKPPQVTELLHQVSCTCSGRQEREVFQPLCSAPVCLDASPHGTQHIRLCVLVSQVGGQQCLASAMWYLL